MKQYKKTIFALTILLFYFLLAFSSTAQIASPGPSVWIADNNFNAPTGSNVFPTIQEAIDAAEAGDYVYVQPSATTYGTAVIEKEIHLVGIGFNLDKDLPLTSNMSDVILRNNIDNTSNASNSTITGLSLRDVYFITYPAAPVFTLDNVTISKCIIQEIQNACCNTYVPVSNLELSDNRFTETIDFPREATNVIFRNNLFQARVTFASTNPNSGVISNNLFYTGLYKQSVGDNMIVQNNNFIGATGSTVAFSIIMIDAIIANNIFYGRTPSIDAAGGSTSANFQRNTFTNNLSFSTGNDELPPSGGGVGNSGSGNLEATSPMFVDVPLLSTWSDTYDFSLQGGSPAINGGSDGSDIGITGGPYPFTSSNFIQLTTPLPTIQSLNTNTIINPGDDLDVSIQAKAN